MFTQMFTVVIGYQRNYQIRVIKLIRRSKILNILAIWDFCTHITVLIMGRHDPAHSMKKEFKKHCVSAGWMFKLSVVYIYIFNEQLIINMILYFVHVCKVIRCFLNICCSFLLCNTQVTCYLYRSLYVISFLRHL